MAKMVCVKERMTVLKNDPDEFKRVIDERVTGLKNKSGGFSIPSEIRRG